MNTSIRSILTLLPLSSQEYTEDVMLEWAYQAVGLMGVSQQMEDNVCTLKVSNYKIPLPPNVENIQAIIIRKSTEITDNDLTELCGLLSPEDRAKLGCDETKPAAYEMINSQTHYFGNTTIGGYNDYELNRINRQGIVNNYNLFIGTQLYQDHFEPVYPSMDALKFSRCEGCPNIDPCNDCPHIYTVNKNNELVFNFSNATICVWYRGWAFNDCGDLMIPDNEKYKQAIVDFVMRKYWETKLNQRDQGSLSMYQMYREQARVSMTKAKAALQLKKLDYNRVRKIVNMYSDFVKQPIVWNWESGIAVNEL